MPAGRSSVTRQADSNSKPSSRRPFGDGRGAYRTGNGRSGVDAPRDGLSALGKLVSGSLGNAAGAETAGRRTKTLRAQTVRLSGDATLPHDTGCDVAAGEQLVDDVSRRTTIIGWRCLRSERVTRVIAAELCGQRKTAEYAPRNKSGARRRRRRKSAAHSSWLNAPVAYAQNGFSTV